MHTVLVVCATRVWILWIQSTTACLCVSWSFNVWKKYISLLIYILICSRLIRGATSHMHALPIEAGSLSIIKFIRTDGFCFDRKKASYLLRTNPAVFASFLFFFFFFVLLSSRHTGRISPFPLSLSLCRSSLEPADIPANSSLLQFNYQLTENRGERSKDIILH